MRSDEPSGYGRTDQIKTARRRAAKSKSHTGGRSASNRSGGPRINAVGDTDGNSFDSDGDDDTTEDEDVMNGE